LEIKSNYKGILYLPQDDMKVGLVSWMFGKSFNKILYTKWQNIENSILKNGIPSIIHNKTYNINTAWYLMC